MNGKKECGRRFVYVLVTDKIQVGEIIKVHKNEDIPCDMVLLSTSDASKNSQCYLTTTNIDGETDIKTKTALALTAQKSLVIGLSFI